MESNRDGRPPFRAKPNSAASASSATSSPKMKPTSDRPWPVNKQMSFEQLQAKLTERLESRGHLNEVKAELRNKLVNELFDMSSQLNLARKPQADSETSKLPFQVSNWLICDFLKRGNFEFTLSTFLRESQLVTNPESAFTIEDILHIMSIPRTSELRKDLIQIYSNTDERGLLYFTIERLLREMPFSIAKTNAQTNTNFSTPSNDETKLFNIKEEEYFRMRIDSEIRNRLNQAVTKQRHLDKTIEIEDDDIDEFNKDDPNTPNQGKESDESLKDNKTEKPQSQFNKETYLSNLKLAESEVHIATLTEQNKILQNKILSLSRVITSQSDYNIIKSELEMVKKELESTTKYFQEMQRKNLDLKQQFQAKISELTMGMVTPSSELLEAHQQLQKAESAFRQDQEALKHQNIRLSDEVKDLKFNYEKAINRIDDLKYHISSLNQLNERLQSEIQNTRYLQDERERQHFRSKSNPNYGGYQVGPQYNIPYHYSNTGAPISRRPENPNSYSSSGSSSLKPPSFIQEAKNRLDAMEIEARNLEQKYGRVIENQHRGAVSSCYPYQLEARLKMARSDPSLNQEGATEVDRRRYSSVQDLNRETQKTRSYLAKGAQYASSHTLASEGGAPRKPRPNEREKPTLFYEEHRRNLKPNQYTHHEPAKSLPSFSKQSHRNITTNQEEIDDDNVGDFPVRYTSSPEPEVEHPERPNFMSHSGDEIMFLVNPESQKPDTEDMTSYSVRYNMDNRQLTLQRQVENPRSDIEVPEESPQLVREKSANNLMDESMPSFFMNSIVEETKVDKEVKEKNSDSRLQSTSNSSSKSQMFNFQPLEVSTPLSKFPESKIPQKNLSTLYENDDQEDVASEKSLSLGNQKEEISNSEDFW